ncbi:MAG: helix-turn-helix domain-containing protein [Streptococcus gallolyticus]|nr:helix-turn-helix domain-containing protein [Streptococcus gallolyticus]
MEKLDIELIGRKVRKLREESGLTREQFCETNINISVKQLMRIE